MLIVGPSEVEGGTVSVRERLEGDQGSMTVEEFSEKLKKEAVVGS